MNTLKMVEMIKKGQKAKANTVGLELVVENQMGSIIITKCGDGNHKGIGETLALTSLALGLEWELLEIQITFEEALEHIQKGNKVRCEYVDEYNKEDIEYYDNIHNCAYFNEIINGKWYLVNE